jgi:hypothetical protein
MSFGKKIKQPRVKLIDRLELLAFRGRWMEGLWVGGLDKRSPSWRTIEEALALIKRHDSVRFSRITRDLERIWVRILPGAHGQFNASLNACELDDRFVLSVAERPELVAAVIVHEATHARLWRCGIGYDEAIRARVEAACFKRERAFAAKLPDGELVGAQAEGRLHYYTSETWTNAALRMGYEEGAAQALRDFGYPEWLIRAIFRFNARWRRFLGFFRARRS